MARTGRPAASLLTFFAVSQRLLRGSAFFPPPPLPGCPDASNTDFNVTVYNTSLVFYSCTKDFLINGRQVQQCNPQSTPDYSYGCTIPELSTCTAEPPTPHGSIVFKSGPKFRVYTCPAGYSFAAGKMTQVAECFFGVWEPASLEDCFDESNRPPPCPLDTDLLPLGMKTLDLKDSLKLLTCALPGLINGLRVMLCAGEEALFPYTCEGLTSEAYCTDDPPPPANAGVQASWFLWIRRVAVVYECDAWHNWASGQSVQFSQCVNGAWTAVDDTCAVSLALDGPPCSDEPRLPAHAVETKALVHSGQRWAVQYECELGYTWPRGRRLRETTCDGGAWTMIHHDCSLGLLSGELSCADPPSPPNKSFITEAWNVSGVNVGVMFRCETGFGWASGRWANFAQCLNNSWAEVDDVCSPGKDYFLPLHVLHF
ncbi:uncharacterized protein [Penaeus vannamei]|uniref:uncharacterized protein n=1 Tax=Penaeus vannamei TaxID=6689 RepID=UPI00387F5B58